MNITAAVWPPDRFPPQMHLTLNNVMTTAQVKNCSVCLHIGSKFQVSEHNVAFHKACLRICVKCLYNCIFMETSAHSIPPLGGPSVGPLLWQRQSQVILWPYDLIQHETSGERWSFHSKSKWDWRNTRTLFGICCSLCPFCSVVQHGTCGAHNAEHNVTSLKWLNSPSVFLVI